MIESPGATAAPESSGSSAKFHKTPDINALLFVLASCFSQSCGLAFMLLLTASSMPLNTDSLLLTAATAAAVPSPHALIAAVLKESEISAV